MTDGADTDPVVVDARADGPATTWRWTGLVAVGWALSWLGWSLAGMRFRWAHAQAYWQFIDRPMLRDHLVQSLWYDHLQPPGLNGLYGLALKVSYDHPDRVLWPLFFLVGAGAVVVVHRLLLALGVSTRTATIVTLVYGALPTSMLVATYLLYTPIEILGVLLIGLLLHRVVTRGARTGDLAGLFATVAVLALTRTLFHLVWVLAIVAVVALARRDRWRTTLAVAALPVALVLGWYVKNLVLFDNFGTSTWLGVNLSRVTTAQLPEAERERLVADGTLSRYAAYPAFTGLEEMGVDRPLRSGPGKGVPILDRRRISIPSFANLHQRDYLVVNEDALQDSLWVVRHRPGTYLHGMSRSWSVTFTAASAWLGYNLNGEQVPGAIRAERYALGSWAPAPAFDDPHLGRWRPAEHEWVLVAGYLVALVGVPVELLRARRRREGDTAALVTLGYLWATTAFVLVATTMLEFGENSRFRSVTDPVVLVTVTALASRWWARRHARAGGAAGPSTRTPAAPPAGT